MVITAIQAILISFVMGIVVGGVVGWKFTFNMRLAKIQEQQILINKLKDELSKARHELMLVKIDKTKEKVGVAVDGVSKSAIAAGEVVSSVASGIRSKIFRKKKEEIDLTKKKDSNSEKDEK